MSRAGNQRDADFDPYYRWLAIPPEEQPPSLYRLLGVRQFESDPEVIAVAADRQMAHIKTFAAGKYSDLSQQLLNELARARIELLHPERRAAYDASLAEQQHSESMIDTDADVEPAGFALDTQAIAASAKTRQVGRRTAAGGFGVHLLFALLGLGMGYSVLCLLGPQYDFLHLIHTPGVASGATSPDTTAPGSSISGRRPAAETASPLSAASPDSAAPSASPPESVRSRADAAPPEVSRPARSADIPAYRSADRDDADTSASDATPSLPPDNRSLLTASETPQKTNARTNDATEGPFAGFASQIVLPALAEGETPIGEFRRPVATDLEIEILQPDPRRRIARTFCCLKTPRDSNWRFYYVNASEREQIVATHASAESESVPVSPIADLTLSDLKLAFRWAPDAEQQPWQRLCNSLLILRAEGEQHVCQLRRVERRPPLTILRRTSDDAIQITIDQLPPKSLLLLEISQLDRFPPLTRLEGDAKRIPAGASVYWKFNDADYAGVAATWRLAKDRVTITATVGVKFQSTGDQLHLLSTQLLPDQQASVKRILAEARREEQLRVRQQPLLERKIRIARQIQSQIVRNQEVKRTTLERNVNEARLAAVRQQQQWAESDLLRFPVLEKLASQIEGRGTIGFRLFADASEHRIVFFETAAEAEFTTSAGTPGP